MVVLAEEAVITSKAVYIFFLVDKQKLHCVDQRGGNRTLDVIFTFIFPLSRIWCVCVR